MKKLLPICILPLLFICGCIKDLNDKPAHKPVLTVSLYAGAVSTGTVINGPVLSATFNNPQGIVTDAASNIYIADSGDHLIRKITPAGVVSTFAGDGKPGYKDGDALSAEFNFPFKIAIDAAGNLYVTEQNSVIRKITPAGVVSSIAYGIFYSDPSGLVVDGAGNLFVADTFDNIIQKVTSDGVVTTYAGTGGKGTDNGPALSATFDRPVDIVLDKAGNLYVAEAEDYLIRKISSDGIVSTYAGNGNQGADNGAALSASFGYPYALTLDNAGNLYVVDQANNNIRKITPNGVVSTYAGNESIGATNGAALSSSFSLLQGIAMDASGSFYVTEGGNDDIRKIALK